MKLRFGVVIDDLQQLDGSKEEEKEENTRFLGYSPA
jgi:hypothetical protein